MTVGIDACLQELPGGLYDIQIGANGDIKSQDFFDTAIIVSIFAEKRANESEILQADLRRGWIGNEVTPGFEIGSKLWLYEQSRLNSNVISGIASTIKDSLKWLVDDGFLISIDNIQPVVTPTGLSLEVRIRRPNSLAENRYYTLWDNTALPCPDPISFIRLTGLIGGRLYNIFEEAGGPTTAVDVVLNMSVNGGAGSSRDPNILGTIETGTGWHPDSKITIFINHSVKIVGGGGTGGNSQIDASNWGGGGGGGAAFGKGGVAPEVGFGAGAGDDSTTVLFGGAGGSFGSSGPNQIAAAENGATGLPAIYMNHDITLINHGTLYGGGGGGGGGGIGGNGGAGGGAGIAGTIGDAGTGTPGSGGAAGPSIQTNGFNIAYAPIGTLIGAVI